MYFPRNQTGLKKKKCTEYMSVQAGKGHSLKGNVYIYINLCNTCMTCITVGFINICTHSVLVATQYTTNNNIPSTLSSLSLAFSVSGQTPGLKSEANAEVHLELACLSTSQAGGDSCGCKKIV